MCFECSFFINVTGARQGNNCLDSTICKAWPYNLYFLINFEHTYYDHDEVIISLTVKHKIS